MYFKLKPNIRFYIFFLLTWILIIKYYWNISHEYERDIIKFVFKPYFLSSSPYLCFQLLSYILSSVKKSTGTLDWNCREERMKRDCSLRLSFSHSFFRCFSHEVARRWRTFVKPAKSLQAASLLLVLRV
jgi:hypothetical protein